jgi:hypothetical protein
MKIFIDDNMIFNDIYYNSETTNSDDEEEYSSDFDIY